MVRIERVFENRFFRPQSPPFRVFEKKLADAFAFERKIGISKEFGERQKDHAAMQFIVYSIGCFESYLQEMFKLFLDKNLLPLKPLLNIPKLKRVQLSLAELHVVNNQKLKFSEIVVSEINFQNYAEITQLCSLIDFDNRFDRIMEKAKESDVGFTKEESEQSMKTLHEYYHKNGPKMNFKGERLFALMIMKNLFRGFAKYKYRKNILGTIQIAIRMRHQIVHKATVVKMPYKGFQISIFLALVTFAAVLQQIYVEQLEQLKRPTSPENSEFAN